MRTNSLITETSTPINEGVSKNYTSDETYSLTGHEPGEVNSLSSSSSTPITSEELVRQIKAAADPLTREKRATL